MVDSKQPLIIKGCDLHLQSSYCREVQAPSVLDVMSLETRVVANVTNNDEAVVECGGLRVQNT